MLTPAGGCTPIALKKQIQDLIKKQNACDDIDTTIELGKQIENLLQQENNQTLKLVDAHKSDVAIEAITTPSAAMHGDPCG